MYAQHRLELELRPPKRASKHAIWRAKGWRGDAARQLGSAKEL
jgi:hypothetical protein